MFQSYRFSVSKSSWPLPCPCPFLVIPCLVFPLISHLPGLYLVLVHFLSFLVLSCLVISLSCPLIIFHWLVLGRPCLIFVLSLCCPRIFPAFPCLILVGPCLSLSFYCFVLVFLCRSLSFPCLVVFESLSCPCLVLALYLSYPCLVLVFSLPCPRFVLILTWVCPCLLSFSFPRLVRVLSSSYICSVLFLYCLVYVLNSKKQSFSVLVLSLPFPCLVLVLALSCPCLVLV